MPEKCRGSQQYPSRAEQSEVTEVNETSSKDLWMRTLEQFLDEMRHESLSRFLERVFWEFLVEGVVELF